MKNNYLNECRQLLRAFELSQADWLYGDSEIASEEFQMEMEQMSVLFIQMSDSLKDNAALDRREKILLTSQIDRMLKYINEFSSAVQVQTDKSQQMPKDLIFLFERQYRFKTILKNHLNDFARLL